MNKRREISYRKNGLKSNSKSKRKLNLNRNKLRSYLIEGLRRGKRNGKN